MIWRVLLMLWMISAAVYLMAISSQFISPERMWLPAITGLLFPVWMAAQIVFLLIFLLLRKWMSLGVLLLLALTANPFFDTFQPLSRSQEIDQVKGIPVMTYNVRLFDIFNWSKKPGAGDSILSYIKHEKPAILCMQEFMVEDEGRFSLDNIRKELGFNPYSNVEYNFHSYRRKHGLAIFSRYPILDTGMMDFENSSNMASFADLQIDHRVVRIYNVHLQSIHIEADQELNGIIGSDADNLFRKLRRAFAIRAEQARLVKDHIRQSPYPVIVCGDFNDTPVSYALHQIRRGLADSFRHSGKGFGATYQFLPWLRIDYIFHSDKMNSWNHRTGTLNGSDHRAVMCMISPG